MTAPIGTAQNVFTGLRELSQVTNTYAGYLQSAGSAYTITLPFQADSFEWWRYTSYGTAGTVGNGIWFRDFPAGDQLETVNIVDNGSTGNHNLVLETTNGITIANTGPGFQNEHKTITGITTATPAVVTSAGHGYTSGQRIVITKLAGALGDELNDNTYVVQVLTVNTYALYDIYGIPITTVGTYTSGGQATLTGPSLGIVNSPVSYKLTLGSAVMGADNDIIYFRASKYNAYFNLGDVS